MKNPIISGFGEPEPVLDGRQLFEYGYCPTYTHWHEYPFDINGISKLFRATSHHTSALVTKRNVLTSLFVPNEILSRREFESIVQNYLVFNNGFMQIQKNALGDVLRIKSRLARHTRKNLNGTFWNVDFSTNHTEYKEDEIIHIYNPDIDQDVYGVPDYLSSINAILLNESATLFRRKYYKNGAHAGYILYMSDALSDQEQVDALEQSIENSKGAGNFKNLFMYVPNGKPDGIKVIPLAEVAAKDQFQNIKITSRDDQLAGHRVPPQLMGIVPNNTGGFGDITKAAKVFYLHEILPIQNMILDTNEQLSREVIKFDEYKLTNEVF